MSSSNPKYQALWPPHHNFPFAAGEPQTPRLIRHGDVRFDAWAPAPGNATPSWTYQSTTAMNAGIFSVAPGGWFDPGDHPNVEIYYILKGAVHLSNPDTNDVVKLSANDAALIPAFAYHHGYNFGNEEVVIYWWVPGEMHTDLFKQKVEAGTLYELGWYERSPVVLNGPHSSNPGFASHLDSLAEWPKSGTKTAVDMVKLGPESWLPLIQGSEPRQAALIELFYADEAIRCGKLTLNAYHDTQPETSPWEKLLYVTQGLLVVSLTGTPDVLKAEVGDAIFIPAGVEHSYLTTSPTGVEAVFGTARPVS